MKRMQSVWMMACVLALCAGCASGTNSAGGNGVSGGGRQESYPDASTATSADVTENTSDLVDELLAGDGETNTQDLNPSREGVYVSINGNVYLLEMEQNVTAQGLLTALGERDLNLPIYNFEGFEGSDVFQYYDIPSRYEVEGRPVSVSSERAGEVYYEEPNRLLLFYRDAEISGNYTLVGQIGDTANLAEDVTDNPVVQGWGNKIISVRRAYSVTNGTEDNGNDDTSHAEEQTMRLRIGDTEVTVQWEDNESVAALGDLVKDTPRNVSMSMYGGFEQVGSLGTSLPRNDVQITTSAGDIVLYSGNQVVVFYGSNSWAYTRLGRITNLNDEELTGLLGNGDVTLTFYME